MRIALLEDDKYQAEVMQVWLQAVGHECQSFQTGKAFMEATSSQDFDLFILDWVLPDTNGIQVLQDIRKHSERPVPVLFVTQMDKEEDVILALEMGADDYMTKPVKPLEMLARITALGRRAYPATERAENLDIGEYRLNTNSRSVEWAGEPVDLTHKEFDLTLFLFRNIGRLLSRSQILEAVWATTADLNTRTVDTHISRIRNKLGLMPENGWKLSAVYQHGYRLERLEQISSHVGEP
ncbi:MAG: response regulator transcription factor [Gammaproteobacteria bacterium]|nr:response regulator transcription factor [Gammaproteobacteria bacterium]